RHEENDCDTNPGWPHRHSGGDCQRRALAQFTRCGVRDRPRHHRGRWIHRTIAENNRSGGDAMAPAMISVGEPVIAMALCESRLRWRASSSFRPMLASMQKERERTLVGKTYIEWLSRTGNVRRCGAGS